MLFYFLFKWSNKLDQTGYLGTLYQETIKDIEFKRLRSDLTEKWGKGEYHREVVQDSEWHKQHPAPPVPDELADEAALLSSQFLSDESLLEARYSALGYGSTNLEARYSALGYGSTNTSLDPQSAEAKSKAAARRTFIQTALNRKGQVDIKAKQLYRDDLDKAHVRAQERAGQAIDVDLSVLRGRGAEFVLEFTTVVVIIFAAIILGVLGILHTEQIGTLLAAIAGYVLGRATTRTRSGASESGGDKTKPRMDETASEPAA